MPGVAFGAELALLLGVPEAPAPPARLQQPEQLGQRPRSITNNATPPTAAQVKAGQNHLGAAAIYAGNQAISTAGFKIFAATGMVTATTYYAYFMHERLPAEQSAVAATMSFTTP